MESLEKDLIVKNDLEKMGMHFIGKKKTRKVEEKNISYIYMMDTSPLML